MSRRSEPGLEMKQTRRRSRWLISRSIPVLVLVGLAMGMSAPWALGIVSAREMGRGATLVGVLDPRDVTPGDLLTETVRFHNPGSEAVDYRLVLIRLGRIWWCDSHGNSLFYEIDWSAGANRSLAPGETEIATITLVLPLAAGNSCQGARGQLFIYRGEVPAGHGGGVYECRSLLPGAEASPASTDPRFKADHICWSIHGRLHSLLGGR